MVKGRVSVNELPGLGVDEVKGSEVVVASARRRRVRDRKLPPRTPSGKIVVENV